MSKSGVHTVQVLKALLKRDFKIATDGPTLPVGELKGNNKFRWYLMQTFGSEVRPSIRRHNGGCAVVLQGQNAQTHKDTTIILQTDGRLSRVALGNIKERAGLNF